MVTLPLIMMQMDVGSCGVNEIKITRSFVRFANVRKVGRKLDDFKRREESSEGMAKGDH